MASLCSSKQFYYCKFYIDGVEQTGITTGSGNSRQGSGIRIGRFFQTPEQWALGNIDDIRIYSDELTSQEVGYIYNNTTASIPTDNLVAYYKLDGDARDEQQLYDGTATNVIYAYNGTATNVTYQEATKFQPDLVWGKSRNDTIGHILFDSVRGENKQISTNTTSAEVTRASDAYLFNSNGFTVTTVGNLNNGNVNYVAWCFKGAGAAVSNTNGSITSQVSANQDAGFSIVKYTSNGSYTSSDTIGHGLSQAPDLVIWKPYSGTTSDWFVQYQFVDGSVDYLLLNAADAKRDSASTYLFQSNVLVNYAGANGQNVIAYCFHSVSGYQKIGSYTGTGVTGNSIVTGFRPRFVMIKRTSAADNWRMYDSVRNGAVLYPNLAAVEDIAGHLSFDSNGFTWLTDNSNGNGSTYIYLAIA